MPYIYTTLNNNGKIVYQLAIMLVKALWGGRWDRDNL